MTWGMIMLKMLLLLTGVIDTSSPPPGVDYSLVHRFPGPDLCLLPRLPGRERHQLRFQHLCRLPLVGHCEYCITLTHIHPLRLFAAVAVVSTFVNRLFVSDFQSCMMIVGQCIPDDQYVFIQATGEAILTQSFLYFYLSRHKSWKYHLVSTQYWYTVAISIG